MKIFVDDLEAPCPADLDKIVRLVRCPGLQGRLAGERDVNKVPIEALFKFKL